MLAYPRSHKILKTFSSHRKLLQCPGFVLTTTPTLPTSAVRTCLKALLGDSVQIIYYLNTTDGFSPLCLTRKTTFVTFCFRSCAPYIFPMFGLRFFCKLQEFSNPTNYQAVDRFAFITYVVLSTPVSRYRE